MPTYTVRGPDGQTYEIKGPPGATVDQLTHFLTERMTARQVKESAQRLVDKDMSDPTKGVSDFNNYAAGVGKSMTDAARGAGQNVGLVTRADVAEARKLDAPLMGTKAGMAGNVTGNIGMAAPLALAPGANTILGAGLYGAGAGVMQPSTSTEETLKNVGLGAAGSAAVPALATSLRVGKSLVEPFYEGGRKQIVGRALTNAAGGEAEKALANLRAATAPFIGPNPDGMARQTMGEIVPGSIPTVGEVAGVPSLAALQRTATGINPTAMNQAAARQTANNEARVASLSDIAGTDGKREFFKANRDATANKLYGEARREGFDPAALTPEAQANIAAFQKRIPQSVMDEAKQLAKLHGEELTDAGSLQGLHWVKKGLDSLIAREAGPSGSKDFLRAYTGLKNDLVEGMGKLSPKYGEANATFAAQSKPLNQMDIAKALMDKSVRPIDGQIMPGQYSRNLSDGLAQKTTGIRSNTLEKVMEPQQLNALQRIEEDLARKNYADTAGKGVGSDTVQKLAYSNILNQAGVPNFIRNMGPAGIVGNLLQRGGQIAYKDANELLSAKLAEALLNPQQAEKLITGSMVTPQMQQIIDNVRRGGTALGASAPALIQANQQ